MAPAKTTVNAPAVVVGGFRLVRRLGGGGFGEVFEALETKTGLTRAVKRLQNTIDPERFEKEALYPALAAKGSLHVLDIQTFFRDDQGLFYLVTDLVAHGDLDSFLKVHKPLSLDSALDIAIGVAKGLAAIHKHGIVHLDLKPANILMDRKDDQWIPKIGDFGLARSSVSLDLNLGATVGYASPEHYDSRITKTPASDMFSFGILLYELLTGERPCGKVESDGEYLGWLHRAVLPSAPSLLRPEFQGRTDVDALVADLLVFEPTKRAVTAEVAVQRLIAARGAGPAKPALDLRSPRDTLQRLATARPVATQTPGNEQAGATPPNRRPPLAAAAVVFVLIIVGGVGVWLQTRGAATDRPVSDAMAKFKAEKYAEAFPLLLDDARAGDADAQRSLGHLYAEGLSVPKNVAEGRRWLEKAVDQNDSLARCELAKMHVRRAFGEPNMAEAEELFSKATSLACGHNGLGSILLLRTLELGPPVPGTFDKAIKHFEAAAEMGDESSTETIRELQTNWPVGPLIPGAWQPVVGAQRRDEIERLRVAKVLDPLGSVDTLVMRRIDIDFYDRATLFELAVTLPPKGEAGGIAYIRRPEGVVLVNGQPAQINRLNASAPIRIDTAQRALSYLRLYQAGALQGPSGPLRIIEEPSDIHWRGEAPPEARAEAARRLRRWTVQPTPSGSWQAEGTLSYAGALFDASLELKLDGTVVPMKREQIGAPLPVVLERFGTNGVRVVTDTATAPGKPAGATGDGGRFE